MTKKSLRILSNAANDVPANGQGNVSRRDFLKILGAGAAVTATGCADSAKQKIFPYKKGEVEQNPGVSVWYSSTCTECSANCGIRVRTREGRAVKIEGNPEHPINEGGLCAMGQASLQHLYDPDRVRQPLLRNSAGEYEAATWSAALKRVKDALAASKGRKAFITGATSGSEAALLENYKANLGFEHVVYETLDPVDLARATGDLFGKAGVPTYSFEKADVVVSFGADFLETWVSPCEFARGWAKGRKRHTPAKFIHLEPRLSLTGSNADLWLKPKPGTEAQVALAVLKELMQRGKGKQLEVDVRNKVLAFTQEVTVESAAAASGVSAERILLVAKNLAEAKKSLVVSGGAAAASNQGVLLAKTTLLINAVLGNIGKTVNVKTLQRSDTDLSKFREFAKQLESEKSYDLVFVSGTNPAYSLPSASRFNHSVRKAGLVVSLSSHLDETARLADVILPVHTSLESWGDTESRDGVHSLLQPVMSPVFNSKGLGELLIELGGKEVAGDADSYLSFIKDRWMKIYESANEKPVTFELFWIASLERGGYFAGYNKTNKENVTIAAAGISKGKSSLAMSTKGAAKKGPILLPYPSVKSFDGRAANKPWLQELPDPVTKAVWGSWVEMHPKTAKQYGLKQGDTVRLSTHYGEVNAPAYVTEYVSEDVVAVPIGGGHSSYGRFALQEGGNVLQMLPDQLNASGAGVELISTRVAVAKGLGKSDMVITQGSNSQMDREIARTKIIDPAGHDDHHDGGHHGHHEEVEHFYDQRKHPLYQWGLAVDLSACTGCSACVVACYAENNIPTVGKEVCDQGREMSWLRIERYYDGPAEELTVSHLPQMCQHCNNAPCEPVCPVYATYHNEEGLNAMIYNRCVGTRYCGNNCSYKVRRYNWFEFDWPEPLNWQLNPDVTKRTAGVMEKCTFCVQRISEGKDRAKDEGRMVRDGEIKPACVQSCPTEALTFGNLNDKNSRVSKLSKKDRAYKILDHHLNTQPSISYLENVKHKV